MKYSKDLEIFDSFVKNNYDYDNELIKTKYIHTLNVTKIIMLLCEKMNLGDEDKELAFYLALFHDLGRFQEVVRQKVFNNLKFDHGAYSDKILFNDGFINNFMIDEKNYLLIKKAIFFHNKKDLPSDLTDREKFFCELIRDADRIDIYRVLSLIQKNPPVFDKVSSQLLLDSFYNSESINIKDLKTKGDRVVLRLGFVKLFSFHASCEVLDELGYLDNYINSIIVNNDAIELFNNLVSDVKAKMKGENSYVR